MAVTPGTSRRKTQRPDDEGELTAEARQELKEARDRMARGEYVTHAEIMARYG